MTSESIKKSAKQWGEKIGHKEAMKRLVCADISANMAEKLLSGRYKSNLSFEKAQAILGLLRQDGIPVADEAS